MPLGRSAAHKIRASALELAKTLISKEVLKSFQRGWGSYFAGNDAPAIHDALTKSWVPKDCPIC